MNLYAKIVALSLFIVTMTSCTTIKHIRKVSKISADRAVKECPRPEEFFVVPETSYGTEIRLMRHENCMEIPNLVMAVWFGDKTEINELTAKLLSLLFIDSKNINSEKQYGHIFLKVDKVTDDDGPYIMFYELVPVDPEDYKGKDDE